MKMPLILFSRGINEEDIALYIIMCTKFEKDLIKGFNSQFAEQFINNIIENAKIRTHEERRMS